MAEIHVDLEGREVARATAPFMGEQLAWEGNCTLTTFPSVNSAGS
ncbi:MAG: hypothetical protein ACLS9N_13055 [[Clostridium] leptum]